MINHVHVYILDVHLNAHTYKRNIVQHCTVISGYNHFLRTESDLAFNSTYFHLKKSAALTGKDCYGILWRKTLFIILTDEIG